MNDKNNNFKEINNNEINLEVLKVSIRFDCFLFVLLTNELNSSLMA